MYEELLRDIGLTENETKIYLALAKLGRSKVSKIISEAKTSGGKIYETLDKLHKKGLISTTKINGINHYQTTSPNSIAKYIDEKKKELEKKEQKIKTILNQFESITKEKETSTEILIGTRSVGPLVEKLFTNAKTPILAMGLRGTKKSKYNNFWWHYNQEIIEKKGKKARYIFIEDKSDYYKKHLKLKNAEIRVIKTISAVAFDLVDNHLLISVYEEDELQTIHIQSEGIARSFEAFFNQLWNMASK